MRRSHGFGLLFLVIVVLAFGWYRGWFTVDQEKVKQDVGPAVQKAKEIGGEIKDKIKQEVNQPNPNSPSK